MRGKHLELRTNDDINAVCSLLFDAFSPGYGRKSLGLSRVKCVAVGNKNVRFVHYWRMSYAGRFFQWRARSRPIPNRAVRHLPRPSRPMHSVCILVTYPRRNSLRLRDPKRIDRAEYWLGLATWQGKTGLNYFLLAVDVAHNVQICK